MAIQCECGCGNEIQPKPHHKRFPPRFIPGHVFRVYRPYQTRTRAIPLALRFWKHVTKSDHCWEWNAARNPAGYGCVGQSGKKVVLAHRAAWELERGAIPDGAYVLHRCDNPPCVRLSHLYIGTAVENGLDAYARGQHLPTHIEPEAHPMRKLTRAQVDEIRITYKPGKRGPTNSAALAARYGVSRTQIIRIVQRRTWKSEAT